VRVSRIGRSAAAFVALGLAACSSSSSSKAASSTATSTSPPTTLPAGTPYQATGFTTVLPDGWSDVTSNTTQESQVGSATAGGKSLALFNQPNPGTDIGHIHIETISPPQTNSQFAPYLASVAQSGATNLTPPQSFTLDGETGQYITYDLTEKSDGAVLHNQDMVVNHAGTTYDIIYDIPTAQFTSLMSGLQALLGAWHWTS
jgi:hypothetical protein